MKSHSAPNRPWQRLGTDIFTFNSKNYLITVDFYSGWFEIDLLNNMLSQTIISKLKSHFALYGIPDVLISENRPQFAYKYFKDFQKAWNFEDITSWPGYPQSNGGAERVVQAAKMLMKKALEDGVDLYMILLNQRNTPRDSKLGSPAQRLMPRQTKTLLPIAEELLKPKIKDPKIVQEQLQMYRVQQKKNFDRRTQELPQLRKGDVVRIRGQNGFQSKGIVLDKCKQP